MNEAAMSANPTHRNDTTSTHELLAMIEALTAENTALQAQVAQLDEFRQLAYRDALTGLYNRRYFEERLTESYSLARRHDENLSLVLIDGDSFKAINDQAGHAIGDAVLTFFGRVFEETGRDYDVPCRLGGDEFALLLPRTDRDGAERLMRRVVAEIARGVGAPELPEGLTIGISYGIAEARDVESAEALVEAADRSMYSQKRARKAQRMAEGIPATRRSAGVPRRRSSVFRLPATRPTASAS